MFKLCRDDMPCEVKKNPIWGFLGGGLKKDEIYPEIYYSNFFNTSSGKETKTA